MKFTVAQFIHVCFPTLKEDHLGLSEILAHVEDLKRYSIFERRWELIREKRLGREKETCILLLASNFPSPNVYLVIPKVDEASYVKSMKAKIEIWYKYCSVQFALILEQYGNPTYGQLLLAATKNKSLRDYLFSNYEQIDTLNKCDLNAKSKFWKTLQSKYKGNARKQEIIDTFNFLKFHFNVPGHGQHSLSDKNDTYRLIQLLSKGKING